MPEWFNSTLLLLARIVGEETQRTVERAVSSILKGVETARYVPVATTAQLGASPFTTRTGPNGTTQSLAAVWTDGVPNSGQVARLPIMNGVTVQEGKTVRIVKDKIGGPWTWISNQP